MTLIQRNNKIYTQFYSSKNKKTYSFSDAISAYEYHYYFRINLLTGKKEFIGIHDLYLKLECISIDNQLELPIVCHFSYYFMSTKKDRALAIFIQYEKVNEIQNSRAPSKTLGFSYNKYSLIDYSEQMRKINHHLSRGDCYQVNLTYRQEIKVSDTWECLEQFKNSENKSPYFHVTHIPQLKKSILSNSPECLFQINKKNTIYTMPIKGSMKRETLLGEKEWELLRQSDKNESELYMITDLLRNDLSKIERPEARVEKKKEKLLVPGLVHQYSLVSSPLSKDVNYLQILKAVFPGGSITGAPKRRVMEIIDDLETSKRGYYCGSTLILHKGLRACSINIRTAVLDHSKNTMTYGTGGGITIKSRNEDEYEEAELKLMSFLDLFNYKMACI